MNAKITKEVIEKTNKFESWEKTKKKEVKKIISSWKFKVVFVLIGLIVAIIALWLSFYAIYSWTESNKIVTKPIITYKIQIPFKDYKVVVPRIISPVIEKMPEKTQDEIVREIKIKEKEMLAERLYQYVRYLESEIGFNTRPDATHVYCQSIGKINEIGYFPGRNKKYCFSTEAKQEEGFMFEYNDRMKKGYTINEFLCEWVNGRREPMCKRSLDIGL